jgi:hypothetical protein
VSIVNLLQLKVEIVRDLLSLASAPQIVEPVCSRPVRLRSPV